MTQRMTADLPPKLPCPILAISFCRKGGKPRTQTDRCHPGQQAQRGVEGPAVVFQSLTCLAILLLAALTLPAFAHDESHNGPVPEEILSRPITRHAGAGNAHQKVTTSSADAQAFYDQGLAYLHSYVWVDAARSFRQALRSDPHLGMAYIGLADAYIGLQDVIAARAACNTARQFEPHMSPAERAWLSIRDLEIAFLESGSDPARYAPYRQAIDDAIQANPRDPWLLVQRGLAAEASPFTHGQASGADSLPFYKKALAIDPNNIAAFHYAIHSNENMGNIKDALDQSAVYARQAYAIPHAHHMHGHELMRMGRTEEAIQEFLKTNSLEEAEYRAENIPAQYDWHHAHNLELMAMNYQLLGQMKTAEKLLRQAFALPAHTELLAYNRRAWPEFLIDRGRSEEALTAARELAKSQWPMARMAAHTLAGEAALALNRIDDAQAELAQAKQEARHMPERVVSALPYPAALEAALLLRQDHTTQEGEAIYVKVEQSAMAMPGPDGWVAAIFALESIGSQARQAGDWQLAQYTAEQMIQHDPYYAGGHFAIGLVAEHAGEADGSHEMFAAAAKYWNHADPDLPELLLTRKKLAAPH
jgi:tetratricopeptide (TPR) repeat protein